MPVTVHSQFSRCEKITDEVGFHVSNRLTSRVNFLSRFRIFQKTLVYYNSNSVRPLKVLHVHQIQCKENFQYPNLTKHVEISKSRSRSKSGAIPLVKKPYCEKKVFPSEFYSITGMYGGFDACFIEAKNSAPFYYEY